MQDGVNVDLPLVRPCHQQGDDVRRFAGAIDVVDHISDAVDDDQTDVVRAIDGLLDDFDAFLRGVFA